MRFGIILFAIWNERGLDDFVGVKEDAVLAIGGFDVQDVVNQAMAHVFPVRILCRHY